MLLGDPGQGVFKSQAASHASTGSLSPTGFHYLQFEANELSAKTTVKLSIEDIIQNSITILKMCQVIFLLMVVVFIVLKTSIGQT